MCTNTEKSISQVSAYRDLPLFEKIEEKDLAYLLVCMGAYERSFRKGEVVILEEQKVRYVGIVLEGTVHMMKEDFWGHRTLLAYMTRGDLCGETFAIQEETDAHVTFVAASNAGLLFIPAANIIHTCPRQCSFHTQIAENLFHLLGRKMNRLMERIDISSKASLREKILYYLSMLAQQQQSRYIEVPLSRTELAAYLGANRSSMTRELSAMRDEGLIDYDRNTFVLKK